MSPMPVSLASSLDAPVPDLQALFGALRQRAPQLALSTAAERRQKLLALRDYLQTHVVDFQDALAADLRRAPLDTITELLMIKGEAEFAARHLAKWTRPQPIANTLMSMGTRATIRYEARGVVLIISPWNAPFACTLVPLVAAIAAGNAVMLKPSELSSHASAVMADLVKELFTPDEVCLVEGDATVAAAILELPFDHICFTGSTTIGKRVMAAAARHLASVTLELGGKSPTIIDETADLEDAAYKVAWGKCANAGQVCVAPDYVLVPSRMHDAFVSQVGTALNAMYRPPGQDFDASPDLCRIVNDRHFQRLAGLLEDAVSRGAKVAFGGAMDASKRFMAPTLLTGVTSEMLVMQEEIFGPLLPVLSYDRKEDALAIIQARPKPLAMYVFSRSRENSDDWIRRTSSGSTVVNHLLIQAGVNTHLPFGGVGGSGMGRSVGKAGFESFSNPRSVIEQPTGFGDFARSTFPPYSPLFQRMIHWLFGA